MTRNELDHAIQSGLDGTLTEGKVLELREILRSDPAARALYYQYVDLNQSLIFRISRFTSTDSARSLAVVRRQIQHRRTIRLAFTAAAAVLIGLGVVLSLTIIPNTSALATVTDSSGTLYTVKHPAGTEDMAEDELNPGSIVNLTQGTLEVELSNGSRGVILGPAEFQLLSGKSMLMHQGTAWFDITEEGVGFQITTPQLVVTDLGTAFGVRSDPDTGDEIHVFSGRVRAHAATEPKSAEILTNGQARRSGSLGKLEKIPSSPESFLTKLPRDSKTGLIVNGGFEAGSKPRDANFGIRPSAAHLPGWKFGRDVSVTLKSEDGSLGHGDDVLTVVSSTRDMQVGFHNYHAPYEVGTLDDSIWQTFSTVPSQRYEVSFEMGAYIGNSPGSDIRIKATACAGDSPTGLALGHLVERRAGNRHSDSGYNAPVSFTFTARSSQTTLVLTETSPNTDLASPAIDNVRVRELRD